MPFAAAMSEHPLTAHAVGEVTGAVLERIGERPDFATVFVTPPHAGALEDVMRTVEEVLHPLVSLGCAAESVFGPHREVEEGAAVTLLAGHVGPLVPLVLDAVPSDSGDGLILRGWPHELPFAPEALVLVGDPYSFPAESFLDWVDAHHPGLRVVGGMASAARGPGGNRLALGTRVRTGGAVGAFLGPGAEVATLVSQGCRPFGDPLVVTKAEHNFLYELAGRPALEQVVAQARDSLSEEEVVLLESGRPAPRPRHRRAQGALRPRRLPGAKRARGGPRHRRHRRRRRRGRGHHRAVPSARRRNRGRGPPRAGGGAPGRRRSRLHVQRPGDAAVRRAPPRRARADRAPRARSPWRGSSPPGSSAPWEGGTSSTGSRRRWPCSATARTTRDTGTPTGGRRVERRPGASGGASARRSGARPVGLAAHAWLPTTTERVRFSP